MKTKKLKNYLKKVDFYLKKAAYLSDIDYLMLKTEWYVKTSNHSNRFKQDRKIIDNYSYKYKFWDTIEKKN